MEWLVPDTTPRELPAFSHTFSHLNFPHPAACTLRTSTLWRGCRSRACCHPRWGTSPPSSRRAAPAAVRVAVQVSPPPLRDTSLRAPRRGPRLRPPGARAGALSHQVEERVLG